MSFLYYFASKQGMHPAFIGAQYPFSMASGPQPPMAATAVTFPGVPVPSMTQIAVHPYHAETGLPLSTTVTGLQSFLYYPTTSLNLLDIVHVVLLIASTGQFNSICISLLYRHLIKLY